MDKLKLMKFVVATLTFLIVFTLLSIIGVIYKKVGKTNLTEATISLAQPQGTSIAEYKVDNNMLHILAKGGNLPDRVIILDLNNSEIKTTINIH